MLKDELGFDLLEVLKEVADKFQPELLERVRNELDVAGLSLLDYVLEHFYQGDKTEGRWYDPYHILFSTHFAVQLIRRTKEQVSRLVVSAIILHDIGYYALTDEAKADWNTSQNRIVHMQEGAALAAKALVEVGSYTAEAIGTIVGMVGTHDNIYLDIPTKDPSRLSVRDADRMWVMHFLSFYKDWISGYRNMSFGKLLEFRKSSIRGTKGPYTCLAKQWLDEQFKARSQEIHDNIIRDRGVFQKYAEEHILTELAAGRG